MDNQCDKCGKELKSPIEMGLVDCMERQDLIDHYSQAVAGYHVVIGSWNYIWPDGDTDWDPGTEIDLCEECRAEFIQLWERWYGR